MPIRDGVLGFSSSSNRRGHVIRHCKDGSRWSRARARISAARSRSPWRATARRCWSTAAATRRRSIRSWPRSRRPAARRRRRWATSPIPPSRRSSPSRPRRWAASTSWSATPGLRRQTSFLDMSFEEWREILSVALDGAFLLGKAFVPQMVAKGKGGAFVAMSGISTHVGTPNRCHVSASKSGLEGLMRALARRAGAAPHHLQRPLARRDRHRARGLRRPASARRTGRSRSSASARSRRSPPWSACWSGRKAPSSPARPSM